MGGGLGISISIFSRQLSISRITRVPSNFENPVYFRIGHVVWGGVEDGVTV